MSESFDQTPVASSAVTRRWPVDAGDVAVVRPPHSNSEGGLR